MERKERDYGRKKNSKEEEKTIKERKAFVLYNKKFLLIIIRFKNLGNGIDIRRRLWYQKNINTGCIILVMYVLEKYQQDSLIYYSYVVSDTPRSVEN